MRGHSSQNDLTCAKDLGDPLRLWKVDLDCGIYRWLVDRCHLLLAERRVQRITRDVCGPRQLRLVVHKHHAADVGPLARSRSGSVSFDMLLQQSRDMPIILFIQNARDVKHAVLEDFDSNLLAKESPVSGRHDDHCN